MTARANGGNTHIWISLEALEHLPEGALKDLLSDPSHQQILLNGCVFPDGGYATDDDYGETAHWEPFLEGYVKWLRRNFDPPYQEGEAAPLVVFLMGVASHDMADQVFDWLFMHVAEDRDASGWSNGTFDSLDSASDVLLVADTGLDVILEPWVPADEMAAVFSEELDYDVAPSLLDSGQDLLELVMQYGHDTGLRDPSRVQELREQYPWSAAHLLDPFEPGSPPTEAVVVAAYWQALWDRLHGVTRAENHIIATVPSEGSLGHPTDHTDRRSSVAVVFGYGIDRDGTLDITVTAPGGTQLPVSLSVRGGQWGNTVRIDPEQDWPADSILTVTVAGGLRRIDDTVFAEDWSFTFSTAAGTPTLPCTDPTANTFDPAPVPSPKNQGGCHTGAPGGAPLPLLLITLLGLWLSRRRSCRRGRTPRRSPPGRSESAPR